MHNNLAHFIRLVNGQLNAFCARCQHSRQMMHGNINARHQGDYSAASSEKGEKEREGEESAQSFFFSSITRDPMPNSQRDKRERGNILPLFAYRVATRFDFKIGIKTGKSENAKLQRTGNETRNDKAGPTPISTSGKGFAGFGYSRERARI